MRTREEVENTISSILTEIKFLMEGYQNCQLIRERMVARADAQMHTFHEGGEVHDYRIICDETNNPPDVVDAEDFRFMMYVKYKDEIDKVKMYGVGYTDDEIARMATT